jgi:hypothetical protein
MTAFTIRAPQSANRQETWIVGALILAIACGAIAYGFVRDEAAKQALASPHEVIRWLC